MLKTNLAPNLLTWWDKGHADLPWRRTRNPYHIWVSEIMLQQTQIATVIPYYDRWLSRFSTIEQLANAPLDDVLKMWEGLGYYSRARNLHTAAKMVVAELNGEMPRTLEGLLALKGVGRYTAGAIASIAFDQPAPVLDGNVIRVLSRLTDLPDDTTQNATKKHLWKLAAELVPAERAGDYNQALMELGQVVCRPTQPKCHQCPVAALCLARERGTQLDRPVRPPRKRTPHYDVAAGVIHNADGQVLLIRRPLNGLLGGLWGFPNGRREVNESLEAALLRILGEIGVSAEIHEPFTTVKHAYTHFRITMHVFEGSGSAELTSQTGIAWVDPARITEYPLANTDRKILNFLQSEIQQLSLQLRSKR